jgi:hypothetical protein
MTGGTGGDTPGREIEPRTEQQWAPWGSIVPEPPPDRPPDRPTDPLPEAPPEPPTDPPPAGASPLADAGRTAGDAPAWGTAPPGGTPMWTPPPPGTPPAWTPPPSRLALPAPPPWGTPPPVEHDPPHPPETPPPESVPSVREAPPGGPGRPTSAVAVAALVVGIAGIVFPGLGLVGIGLAVVALVHLRGRRERGRGIAVAGLVVSLLWPVVFLAAAVAAFSQSATQSRQYGPDPVPAVSCEDGSCGNVVDEPNGFVATLVVGDCLAEVPDPLRDDADGTEVDVVDCEEEHVAQVYDTVSAGGGEYPGESVVRRRGQQRCASAVPASARADVAARRARVVVAYPGPQVWDETHQAACLLVTDEPRTSGYDIVPT